MLLSNAIVTAYCACRLCCGTHSGGPTASGSRPTAGITIAGPRAVALGTSVFLPGFGWRVVQDRTARKYDGRWDIYVSSHKAAKKFGRKRLDLTILEKQTK